MCSTSSKSTITCCLKPPGARPAPRGDTPRQATPPANRLHGSTASRFSSFREPMAVSSATAPCANSRAAGASSEAARRTVSTAGTIHTGDGCGARRRPSERHIVRGRELPGRSTLRRAREGLPSGSAERKRPLRQFGVEQSAAPEANSAGMRRADQRYGTPRAAGSGHPGKYRYLANSWSVPPARASVRSVGRLTP